MPPESPRCPTTGKRRFISLRQAKRGIPKRSGDRLRVYRCPFCRGFHYTSKAHDTLP